MQHRNMAGANYLRRQNRKNQKRIWTDGKRRLYRIALDWLQQGLALDIILRRVSTIGKGKVD